MSEDIQKILSEWKFVPNEVTARIITGDDGRERIQLRVDLGILQMEMKGRPDGMRPEGKESWFDYYRDLQESHDAAHVDSPPFMLDLEACQRLWFEGVQYYHRYLCFWHLKKYELCAGDTQRNLNLFDFVREHVSDQRMKLQFDQWRPYVLMLHARSVGTPLVEMHQYGPALEAIESGVAGIHDFLEQYGQEHRADQCAELLDLQTWHKAVLNEQAEYQASRGELTVEILRRKLQEAVELEEFEEAARLRDEIRRLENE